MKIRIKGNSLRLRLLRGEVARFGEKGRLTETICFGASPDQQLTYSLEIDDRAKRIGARFADNQITVTIPEKTARNWIDSDLVTLEINQSVEADMVLKILVEKDFVCLDRKDDPENADAFPHPTGKCASAIKL